VRYPEMCTAVSLRYPALVQRAVARGAHVHVPSDYVAGEVIELLGVPRDRVGVVPHGVDHVTPLDVVPDDPPYVLALGTVEPRKDYPGLVRAFEGVAAIHTNVRLVIAGRDGWGVDATDAAIAASPFRARIERRQVDGDAARREILARAHVLVYPSVYEGFGLPPLEAMAAGTPVVATAAGAVPEVIGDAALLVPVGDVDALAAAITKVLDDESTCAALRTSGSERAARFTWKACAAGLVDLYARAVEAAGKT